MRPFLVLKYNQYFFNFSLTFISWTSFYCTDIFTIPFPINLGSLTGTSGYIEFDISPEVLKLFSTPLTVQVSTNRGKAIEKKLHFENLVDLVDML